MSSFQKFCKVCQDAGKPESVYRSHFTRESPDPSSKVVCPTLLDLNCRYCAKNGHTVKYCPVIKKKEKEAKYNAKRVETKPVVQSKPVNIKSTSAFACLADSDSDEEPHVEEVSDFPELPSTQKIELQKVDVKPTLNYAVALANTKPKPVAYKNPEPVEPVKVVETLKPKGITAKPAPWVVSQPLPTRCDWTAFDTEDEEDEIYSDEEYEEYNKYNNDEQDDTW